MTEFTPISATLGGLLIGLAAAVMLLAYGRITGISGLIGQAMWPSPDEGRAWNLAFLAGMPIGAGLVAAVSGPLALQIEVGAAGLVAAGLLVGFGTRLGRGCTSGHGVCGISRGSLRSLVATVTFMGAGAVTVYVTRHLLGGGA